MAKKRNNAAKGSPAKIRYGTLCNIHGTDFKGLGKNVFVPVPRNKRERQGGCPVCN